MKTCLILAVVGLTVAVLALIAHEADAHVPNRRGEGGRDRHGSWGSDRRGDGYGEGHRGGRHGKDRHHGHRGGHWRRGCECGNQCSGNTGTKNIGCFRTRAEYLQCANDVCTKQSCPDNQMFNFTSKVCETCPAGYHVDAERHRCVCDQGTTFDYKTRQCVPCPSGAVVTADRCYCDNSVLDKNENTCRACPSGTTRRGRHCSCSDPKLFWNHATFSCQACPGVWTDAPQDSSRRRSSQRSGQICQCEGENQLFNKWSVSCITCPANSMVATRRGKAYCDCLGVAEKYDWKTNKCVNKTADDDDDDDDNTDAVQPE